ncbi:aldo/keto reductase (plasmid) [Bosea vestrisii]|uniref:aldo/keto reductase n=1 Tax=Bosea vestrisii TaxID=151416 RepID=UPI0024E029C2|nr:aldo/keto reductase [Bosea vestrisii]WID99658.1 aldo/keto reductase [Bosea vestrisii]
MKYHRLGASGLSVSRLCLGAMMFGDQTSETDAARIVGAASEAGVNFIDTADVYAGGDSERVVGRALARERDRWIVATKVGTTVDPRIPNQGGNGRQWLIQSVEQSLMRLGTDRIDIYYLHLDDLTTPLEETLRGIDDLIRGGKIRYWGVSNFRAWRISEIVNRCLAMGVPKPVVGQPYYNAMNRMPEVEYLPACANYGIGVVPYSPLARGILSGKYTPGATPEPGSRAGRKDMRMLQTEFRAESIEAARIIREHAERTNRTAIGFAVNWVLANPIVSAVIAGPRTPEQWQAYLTALDEEFGPEDEALVDRLVPKGHPSTPGYTDPIYPVLGRPANFPR